MMDNWVDCIEESTTRHLRCCSAHFLTVRSTLSGHVGGHCDGPFPHHDAVSGQIRRRFQRRLLQQPVVRISHTIQNVPHGPSRSGACWFGRLYPKRPPHRHVRVHNEQDMRGDPC